MKIYPLESVKPLFADTNQTFQDIGVKINPCVEGINITPELVNEKTKDGLKKLVSLEFNWLPADVVNLFNMAENETDRRNVLINKIYGNCKLNCKGCYVKQDSLYKGKKLLHPDQIMNLIQEAVDNLGTITLKYLGPTEFFRDKDVFKYLDRFQKMGILLNIFVKDPMFGSDQEVENLFGDQGLHTAEQLVKKLASYENLRILFGFTSFDDERTNYLVKDGYQGKKNYTGNYKKVQTRAIQLLYKYLVKAEIKKGKAGRLMILNTMIRPDTVCEALEIFRYFNDRGVPVCSTTFMQSGCGGQLYASLEDVFLQKLAEYYAQANKHAVKRGIISEEELYKFGSSPYPGTTHCIQLCNGLLIRETGQLMRCPGADHGDWQDAVTVEELLKDGLTKVWPKTINYKQKTVINNGCLAKPKVFTSEFKRRVMEIYEEIK